MGPVWKLLKSRQNDEEWNAACRGALKSSLAGRQYPQTRVFAAGWPLHNRCILCLYNIVQEDAAKNTSDDQQRQAQNQQPGQDRSIGCEVERAPTGAPSNRSLTRADTERDAGSTEDGSSNLPTEAMKVKGQKQDPKERIKAVEATEEQINRAPVGNSNHRIWRCPASPMEEARQKWARPEDRRKEASCDVAGHPAWERGLMPKPSPPRTKVAATASFRWIVRPEGDMFHGEIYPDGSALDGPNPELMRCGWAFVVISFETGEVVASACGVPPHGSPTLEGPKPGRCCKQQYG